MRERQMASMPLSLAASLWGLSNADAENAIRKLADMHLVISPPQEKDGELWVGVIDLCRLYLVNRRRLATAAWLAGAAGWRLARGLRLATRLVAVARAAAARASSTPGRNAPVSRQGSGCRNGAGSQR